MASGETVVANAVAAVMSTAVVPVAAACAVAVAAATTTNQQTAADQVSWTEQGIHPRSVPTLPLAVGISGTEAVVLVFL